MIKSTIWLLMVMLLPVTLAAPEPQTREDTEVINTVDPDYPSLTLTPLSPWS